MLELGTKIDNICKCDVYLKHVTEWLKESLLWADVSYSCAVVIDYKHARSSLTYFEAAHCFYRMKMDARNISVEIARIRNK